MRGKIGARWLGVRTRANAVSYIADECGDGYRVGARAAEGSLRNRRGTDSSASRCSEIDDRGAQLGEALD